MPTQNYLISCINTQNGRRFPHGVFKLIFFNENCCIVSKIAQKYGFKGPIDNISALDQIMACRRTGENLNQWWLVYWRIYASLGFNESSYIKMNYRCPCKCMGALNKRRSEISFHQRWPVLYFPLWLLFSQNQTFFLHRFNVQPYNALFIYLRFRRHKWWGWLAQLSQLIFFVSGTEYILDSGLQHTASNIQVNIRLLFTNNDYLLVGMDM